MKLNELYKLGANMLLTINHDGTDFLDIKYGNEVYTLRSNLATIKKIFYRKRMGFKPFENSESIAVSE